MTVQIIAEVGSNHNGSLEQAYDLIDAAAHAGADSVKFQLFNPDELYPGQHTPGSIEQAWLPRLDSYCRAREVIFGCSVFDLETLERYLDFDPEWVKIASPEAMNRELLEEAANCGVPLLVSTGAMDIDDLVFGPMEILDGAGVTWMHCTSAYPAPAEEMNLRALWCYPEPYGLSDHSLHPSMAPVLAVALGASVIEKHITLDRNQAGADHGFALEPDEFRTMVADIRLAEVMLGDGVKRVQPSEDRYDRRTA